MTHFSHDDRHRSLRRFLMTFLGSPPWKIRTERMAVSDEQRPVALIEAVGETVTTRSRSTVPQGDVEKAQAYAITLWTEIPEVDTENPGRGAAEARVQAEAVASLLEQALTVGIVNDDGSSWSYPEMLPLFDYGGVATAGVSRAGPPDPYAWMRVDAYGVGTIQDPDDATRWTVTCSLRVSWEQAGRAVPVAPSAGSMDGSFVP